MERLTLTISEAAKVISELMEYSGMSRNAIKNWVDHQPSFERDKKGKVKQIDDEAPHWCQSVSTNVSDTDS
jgi:hypothetical protein